MKRRVFLAFLFVMFLPIRKRKKCKLVGNRKANRIISKLNKPWEVRPLERSSIIFYDKVDLILLDAETVSIMACAPMYYESA